MKIHEYQAKELLRGYGIPVPDGGVARTGAEAFEIARNLGGKAVVKAQIQAGGRGKGGGVQLVENPGEAERVADGLIGKPLITHQTGPEGKTVNQVLVEGTLAIERELYLGMVVDRASEGIAVMASTEGGVEIEKVAEEETGLFPRPHRPDRVRSGLVHLQTLQAFCRHGLFSRGGQPPCSDPGPDRYRPGCEDQLR